MQLAKVVIASALVLAAYVEGLPEGINMVIMYSECEIFQTAYLGCVTELVCFHYD